MSGGKVQKIFSYFIAVIIFAVVFVVAFYEYSPVSENIYTNEEVAPKPQNESINIVIFGDMMLDRRIRRDLDQKGVDYIFGGVKDLIKNADIAVANLEGPITNFPSKTIDFNNKSLQFTFDPRTASMLKDLGFDVLGLGNNHLLDFGEEGYRETVEFLRANDIAFYGHPKNNQNISVVATAKGYAVAFVGYHQFTYTNKEEVLKEISRLKPYVDLVVVTPHWGEEYQPRPSPYIKELAKEFVRAGADAIIGTHPHVLQGSESIDGVPVIYSLGNFVFDQDFSKETQLGMAVTLNVQKRKATTESPKIVGASVSGLPISIVKSQATIATSTDAVKAVDKVLENLLTR